MNREKQTAPTSGSKSKVSFLVSFASWVLLYSGISFILAPIFGPLLSSSPLFEDIGIKVLAITAGITCIIIGRGLRKWRKWALYAFVILNIIAILYLIFYFLKLEQIYKLLRTFPY